MRKIKIGLVLENPLLFLRIASFIAALPFVLRMTPMSAILKSCLKDAKCAPRKNEKEAVIDITDFFFSWRLPVFRGSCLKRSLVLFKFLRRIGINVDINFGVNKNRAMNNLKHGHAWLTLDGKLFFPKEEFLEHYQFCYKFPENGKEQ